MPFVTEGEAIPYEPVLLRGERLLVLAPHPDDEVIACGGLIALHLREGRAVRIVVVTDGAAQGGNAALREEESRFGVARLGTAELELLRFPDRALDDAASSPILEQVLAFRPDLILVPSPVEIHPDHVALSRVFCELVQRHPTLFAELAVARVAFYEVSQPLRPNAIVDITAVAEEKYAAIAEHRSQLAVRDYVAFARGLNAYRTMTLPSSAKYAEAYHVVELPSLRTTAFSELQRRAGMPLNFEITRETVPISVVIRTKDRPALLHEAIDSVRATGYPCEIVVVNDGGAKPDVAPAAGPTLRLIEHETSRGRAEAGNAGARGAANRYLAFLDDDDLFYPEHLATLANATSSNRAGWYTDAVSAFLRPGESGAYETYSRLRLFAQDFDPDLLLLDNYIPLPAMLVARETFLDAGAFDPAFDLFEDWDFLIRLSRRGQLQRIPRVTCEVRHFEGGTSVVLAAPEGSERFRAAKLQVWKKHEALLGNNTIANAFESQKRKLGAMFSQLVETEGRADLARHDSARLEREKNELLQSRMEQHETISAYSHRVQELEASVATLNNILAEYTQQVLANERLAIKNDEIRAANQQAGDEIEHLRGDNALLRGDNTLLRVEIQRLNGLLEMIYRSHTWKAHTLLEKLRGRG
jgi:LmbE family N-acetylglucosaminyl deacetylase/glycosyltransferase involved in cell wall biosynthesis